jgi:hypothetical protein
MIAILVGPAIFSMSLIIKYWNTTVITRWPNLYKCWFKWLSMSYRTKKWLELPRMKKNRCPYSIKLIGTVLRIEWNHSTNVFHTWDLYLWIGISDRMQKKLIWQTCEQRVASSWKKPFAKSQYSRVVMWHWP